MRKTLTDKSVQALKPRPKRYAYPDPELRGHYVRIQPSGAKAFVTVARDPAGKQVWTNIGAADVLTVDAAREQARTTIARIRAGLPASEPPEQSFEEVARRWLEREVKDKLRSEKNIVGLLELHALPFWKGRPFLSIRRSDVTALMDDVADGHGERQADQVLTVISSMMHWFARRHDDYLPPIIRGMRLQKPKERARKRILADDELWSVWKAAEDGGTFGAFVRFALLTGQRKAKVATLKWTDVSLDGEWAIPQEAREKDSAGSLMLPPAALDIIKAQPRLGDNPFVFASGRVDGPIGGFSKAKREFDARLTGVDHWTIHDLRRTARSLMSRAGVPREHAERVLGHAIGGVEGVYDRHAYRNEKAEALRRLAGLIDGLVHPRENVTPMRRAKRR